eukprot:TRINITY_DN18013_c0_g1_i1.p1 TRINITY_DN18013_c0_g1~~TRINITY_DN18013_c0_g1_i1.p1  ORF type:complete len:442 (+),score=35.90 TRINITY_DN18013_c0_g1_i1:83-1408(+)
MAAPQYSDPCGESASSGWLPDRGAPVAQGPVLVAAGPSAALRGPVSAREVRRCRCRPRPDSPGRILQDTEPWEEDSQLQGLRSAVAEAEQEVAVAEELRDETARRCRLSDLRGALVRGFGSLRGAFARMNLDAGRGSAELSLAELRTGLAQIGMEQQAEAAFAALDTDNSGAVELGELLAVDGDPEGAAENALRRVSAALQRKRERLAALRGQLLEAEGDAARLTPTERSRAGRRAAACRSPLTMRRKAVPPSAPVRAPEPPAEDPAASVKELTAPLWTEGLPSGRKVPRARYKFPAWGQRPVGHPQVRAAAAARAARAAASRRGASALPRSASGVDPAVRPPPGAAAGPRWAGRWTTIQPFYCRYGFYSQYGKYSGLGGGPPMAAELNCPGRRQRRAGPPRAVYSRCSLIGSKTALADPGADGPACADVHFHNSLRSARP